VLEPLRKQADDVLIVEGIEDHLSGAAGTYHAQVTEEAELVGHGRLAEPEQAGNIADAQLGAGNRVEDTHASDVAEHLERLGERRHGGVAKQFILYCMNI
jgi:hypothetical protein